MRGDNGPGSIGRIKMIPVDPFGSRASPPRCLFLGAHCDDIEIGCGGTILKLVESQPDTHVNWVVFSSGEIREKEARSSAVRFLDGLENYDIEILNFRNSFFPQVAADIKEHFEKIKKTLEPDVVFTHFRGDLHQDHRTVAELTWNTFRNHLILEYEIPKYDGGLGSPNAFVELTSGQIDRKVSILMDEFSSQHGKSWFTEDTFRALPRLRGIECNAQEGLAESFYCSKFLMSI